jgi:hypothetical protein
MPPVGVNPVACGVLRNTHASWGGRSTGPPTPVPLARSQPLPGPIHFAPRRSRPPHPATTSVSRRSAPPVKETNIVSGWSRPPLSASDRPAPGSEPPPRAVFPLVCPRPASAEAGAAQRRPEGVVFAVSVALLVWQPAQLVAWVTTTALIPRPLLPPVARQEKGRPRLAGWELRPRHAGWELRPRHAGWELRVLPFSCRTTGGKRGRGMRAVTVACATPCMARSTKGAAPLSLGCRGLWPAVAGGIDVSALRER